MTKILYFTLICISATLGLDLFNQLCSADISCPSSAITINGNAYVQSDFNALSFGDFSISSGDVEGRVATKNNFFATAGVSVGYSLRNTALPYSLIVGRDALFTRGEIYPNEEKIFVGGAFDGPDNLRSQVTGNCSTAGCLDSSFDSLKSYFDSISAALAAKAATVITTVVNGGLNLNCSSSASVYYVSITATDFSALTSYVNVNCNSNAIFVFNIQGTGSVLFQGASFVTNTAVYNIISAASVSVSTSVAGAILASSSNYIQSTGTVYGQVIALNVSSSVQINIPVASTSSTGSVSTSDSTPLSSSSTGSLSTGSTDDSDSDDDSTSATTSDLSTSSTGSSTTGFSTESGETPAVELDSSASSMSYSVSIIGMMIATIYMLTC